MRMRACRPVFVVTAICLAATARAEPAVSDTAARRLPAPIPASDEVKREQADTRVFALMSGKCSTLSVAGRDFACRAVAYFQNEEGRGNFAIALEDPGDQSHI